MRLRVSWPKRLFDKVVHDALPAGLAIMIGGLLVTHRAGHCLPRRF